MIPIEEDASIAVLSNQFEADRTGGARHKNGKTTRTRPRKGHIAVPSENPARAPAKSLKTPLHVLAVKTGHFATVWGSRSKGALPGGYRCGQGCDPSGNLALVRRRLAELDAERVRLEATLADFEGQLSATNDPARPSAVQNAPVTGSSSASEKLALFRRLFAGRPDVLPVRSEGAGLRVGPAILPPCSNEWVKGVCRKPKVKCGECPHQAFIPPSDDIIERHLRGGDPRSGDFGAGCLAFR